jgi:hypothetical protein
MNAIIQIKYIFWHSNTAFFTDNTLKWTLLKMTLHHISHNIFFHILIKILELIINFNLLTFVNV